MVHSLYLRRFILHIVVLIALVVANDLLSCRDVSSLADALPPSSCCWVDALPPVVASSLADALPPFFFSGGCFAAVVVLFGRCFATVSCSLSWHLWRQYILFLQVQLFGWQVWSALLFLALAVCVFVCTFLQYFSVFSPLWSCIGQVLFGHIKSVSVTAFFLMKNVLRHGREKKNIKSKTTCNVAYGCVLGNVLNIFS